MAKRRLLKKSINYITGELFADCLAHKCYVAGNDPQQCDALLTRILKLQDEYISRISHTEPGNVKGFYKQLRESFNADVEAIMDEIDKLN